MNQQRDCFVITGSSGLLGHALSHHFGSKNNLVIGLDQEGPPYPPPNAECLFCDLTSDESVQKTFFMIRSLYGTRIKAVIHLAAFYSFSGKDSPMYNKLTVQGTERLLRELQKFDVGQFIFTSSMLVYKPNPSGEKLVESSALEPTWAYPASKVDAERLIQEKRGKIPAVILRIAGVYTNIGESIPLAHQIQRIYEHQLEGHLYSGDPSVKQSYVHLSDVVEVIDACVRNASRLSEYEVFNVGEEHTLSYDEIQQTTAKNLFGEEWKTFDVPKPIAKAGAWIEDKLATDEHDKPFVKPWMVDRADDNYELDTTKARRVLGWEPKFSLERTLPLILQGLKTDPIRWYKVNELHMPESLKQKLSDSSQSGASQTDFTPPANSTDLAANSTNRPASPAVTVQNASAASPPAGQMSLQKENERQQSLDSAENPALHVALPYTEKNQQLQRKDTNSD